LSRASLTDFWEYFFQRPHVCPASASAVKETGSGLMIVEALVWSIFHDLPRKQFAAVVHEILLKQ
jgi:hypothetical protein